MSFAYNLQLFKEIFFPRRCAVCHTEIEAGLVCSSCRENFALAKVSIYGAENGSWKRLLEQGQPLEAEDIFDRRELLYRYDGAFKEALHSLKFEQKASLLPLLREEAAIALEGSLPRLLKHYDLITTIPTSEERRRARGFDVPWELFAEFKGRSKYTERILQRIKGTAPLYTMAETARRAELEGCFALRQAASVSGKRVLLCDDIYTTGSTMKEAAQVLLRAGAKSVGVLAFCASKDNWS